MKTESVKANEIVRDWYVVDAEGKTLGRLASGIAQVLRGKNKVNFTHHLDMSDFLVVINADKIVITGNKKAQSTMRPGFFYFIYVSLAARCRWTKHYLITNWITPRICILIRKSNYFGSCIKSKRKTFRIIIIA